MNAMLKETLIEESREINNGININFRMKIITHMAIELKI